MAKQTDSKKLRSTAEDMYIHANMTGRDIAELLGVAEQTISRWKKGRDGERDWEERRAEVSITPGKVKEILMGLALNVAKGEKTDIDAAKLSKIVSAIDRLDKKVNARITIDVFKEFDNFMAEINPTIAVEFTKYHKLFIQHKIAMEA
jgi:transcriptional regulator with XRE-family HTH domain